MSRAGSRRRPAFVVVLALLVLALFEAFSYGALAVLEADPRFDFTPISERQAELKDKIVELLGAQGEALLLLDEELGWTYRADYRGELYSSNSRALRGQREYAEARPPGTLRIAAFGDSFVHANEVGDADAWSAQLEALEPRIEALNFGVGGYGTDQALLHYERRGREFDAQVVLLGFAEVNYARNLNRFRRFLSVHELPLFKPRFRLSETLEGDLEFVPNPVPGAKALAELVDDPDRALVAAEQDWFFEPLEWRNPLYDRLASVRLASSLFSKAWRSQLRPGGLYRGGSMNTDSEGFRLLVALVRRFAERVEQDGKAFAFVIFPGRDGDIWRSGPPVYQPLLDALQPEVRVLDLADALAGQEGLSSANLREGSGHYTPLANSAVATALRDLSAGQDWFGLD